MKLSARNQLQGTVTAVKSGAVMAEVEVRKAIAIDPDDCTALATLSAISLFYYGDYEAEVEHVIMQSRSVPMTSLPVSSEDALLHLGDDLPRQRNRCCLRCGSARAIRSSHRRLTHSRLLATLEGTMPRL